MPVLSQAVRAEKREKLYWMSCTAKALKREDLLKKEIKRLNKLLMRVYYRLRGGNCPFCTADFMSTITPGTKARQKGRHGHPKSCPWMDLKAEVGER